MAGWVREAATLVVAASIGAAIAIAASSLGDRPATEVPAVVVGPRASREAPASYVAATSPAVGDAERIRALEGEVVALRERLDSPPPTPAAPPRPRRTLEQAKEVIATAFEDESTDADWAASAEQALFESSAHSAFEGAELLESECRSTMCRAVVHFRDPAAHSRFHQVIDLEPWTHGGLIHETGPNQVEVYIVRPGHRLPDTREVE